MNYRQNPTTHPEIGPRNSVGVVDRPTGATGTIIFNRPTSAAQGPKEIIAKAVANGDTAQKRSQQLREALTPHPEQ